LQRLTAALLTEEEEITLLKAMAGFPALIEGAAVELAPHRVIILPDGTRRSFS
jgi:arginyl-tRNA synthetase